MFRYHLCSVYFPAATGQREETCVKNTQKQILCGVHDPLLSADQVRANLGGIGKTFFYSLLKQQGAPKGVTLGRRRMWRSSEIQAWIFNLSSEGDAP